MACTRKPAAKMSMRSTGRYAQITVFPAAGSTTRISSSTAPKKIPTCPVCGKLVRPDVTLYGEFLPEKAYQGAIDLINRADCLIIGGTSLEVGSAAQLAHMYHGQYLIIINKGKTRMEGKADLVFHDRISEILSCL